MWEFDYEILSGDQTSLQKVGDYGNLTYAAYLCSIWKALLYSRHL